MRRHVATTLALCVLAAGRGLVAAPAPAPATGAVTRAEARTTAHDAYLYAFPMLEHYRVLQRQVADPTSFDAVARFGRFRHNDKILTPDDHDVAAPNIDTAESWAWLDLRAEPWVLVVPPMKDRRYHAVQLIDLYTYNFAYVGSRATGAGGGRYAIAGPRWKDWGLKGIRKVFRSESDLVLIRARTTIKGPDDIPELQRLQASFDLWPLSKYYSLPPPPPAPPITFPAYDADAARTSGFIPYLNFLLQFCQPPHPDEVDLLERFSRIGIGPGLRFDPESLKPEVLAAIEAGIKDAQAEIAKADRGPGSMIDRFGTRKFLAGDYLKRAVGADQALYTDSVEEVWTGTISGDGNKLSMMHFPKGERPQGKYRWSMTLYTMPDRTLYANPLQRYSLGERAKGLALEEDKGLKVYIGHNSPGKDKESNWLPAPEGPYIVVFRIYGPNKAEMDGSWKLPPLLPVTAPKKK